MKNKVGRGTHKNAGGGGRGVKKKAKTNKRRKRLWGKTAQ